MDLRPAILTFDQLVADGWTADGLTRAVNRGELSRVRRGVFQIGTPAPRLPEVAYRELVVATAREAGDPLVSHVSAVALYDLPLVEADLAWVHTTCDRVSGGQRRAGVHRHVGHRIDDTRRIDGVLVTSPARTLIDLARTTTWRTAVPSIDEAIRTRLVHRHELVEELGACGRQHGLARARTALLLADGRSETPGESLSRVVLHTQGIQLPISQVQVLSAHGQVLGRCDFWFEGTAALGEFDGLAKYGGIPDGPDARTELIAEKLREDAIRAEGGVLARWIWSDLSRPGELAKRVQRAIDRGRRAQESGDATLSFRPVS